MNADNKILIWWKSPQPIVHNDIFHWTSVPHTHPVYCLILVPGNPSHNSHLMVICAIVIVLNTPILLEPIRFMQMWLAICFPHKKKHENVKTTRCPGAFGLNCYAHQWDKPLSLMHHGWERRSMRIMELRNSLHAWTILLPRARYIVFIRSRNVVTIVNVSPLRCAHP